LLVDVTHPKFCQPDRRDEHKKQLHNYAISQLLIRRFGVSAWASMQRCVRGDQVTMTMSSSLSSAEPRVLPRNSKRQEHWKDRGFVANASISAVLWLFEKLHRTLLSTPGHLSCSVLKFEEVNNIRVLLSPPGGRCGATHLPAHSNRQQTSANTR
jgi:hypothetical protein